MQACYNRSVYTAFQKILTQKCAIKWDRPLVVGVSGGADSLTLLHLLTRAKVPALAVYFDHQLRSQAATEAEMVGNLAREWGAAFLTGSADVRYLACDQHLSLEAAARQARYAYLFDMACLHHAQGVATGHTADDQVETILLHLLRGSGLDGLRGMSYVTRLEQFSTNLPLFRPMLGFWRAEIDTYLREHGIHPLEDHTNRDILFQRNRIRHELIPALQTYNPQIKARIVSLGQSVEDGLRILQPVIKQAFDKAVVDCGEGWLTFCSESLRSLQPELTAFVLRHGIHTLQPFNEDITRAAIEQCVEQIHSQRLDGSLVLGDGIELVFAQQRLYLRKGEAAIREADYPWMDAGVTLTLEAPGHLELSHGWVLHVEQIDKGQTQPSFGSPWQAWLDGERTTFPLEIRGWRAGDRFTPFGMANGSVRVADFLNQKRVPRPVRKNIPLVLSAGEIVWVAGLQIGEKFRVSERCGTLLRLRVTRIDGAG